MTKLSVNINKIATIRNARGGNTPNVVEAAINCQKFGADGITIHPRQDQRHIRAQDCFTLKNNLNTIELDSYNKFVYIGMITLIINDDK